MAKHQRRSLALVTRRRLLLLVSVLAVISTAPPCDAQTSNSDDARFDVVADRYWQVLRERPRKGTAFDHWYRHYAQAERLAELRHKVQQWAAAEPRSPQPLVLTGLLLEQEGKPAEALLAYERAEQLAPDDYYPGLCRGMLLFRQQRYQDAIGALDRALQLEPPRTDAADVVETLVRCHLRDDDRDAARKVWTQAFALRPGDVREGQRLAEIVTTEGDAEAAIELWQRVAHQARDNPVARTTAEIEIAQLYADQGNQDEAVERFARVLHDVKPEGWLARDICRRIARTYLSEHDRSGLVEFWRAQRAERPRDLQALLNLARALQLAGKLDEALDFYRQTIELAPTHAGLRRALVDVLVEARRFDEAVTHCEALLAENPTSIELLRMLGQLYLKAASPQEQAAAQEKAIGTWRRIAELRPEDAAAALQAAEACRHAALVPSTLLSPDDALRPTETNAVLLAAAESFYREAVQRAGASDARLAVPYLDHLGEYFHTLERPEDAVAAWWKICAPPHDSPEMCREAAEVFMKYGKLPEAEEAIRRALNQELRNFDYLELLVNILIERKDFAAAYEQLPTLDAMADAPALEEVARNLRLQVCMLGKYAEREIKRLQAVTAAEKAALTDVWLLAALYSQQGQHDSAAAMFERALTGNPANARLVRDYAAALERGRKFEQSIAQIEKLIDLEPHLVAAHYRSIVQLQMRRGEYDLARAFLDKLAKVAPDDVATHQLRIDVGRWFGRNYEQVDLVREAVRALPEDTGFRRQLAHALVEQGDHDEALAEYWQCWEMSPALFERISLVATMSDMLKTTGSWQLLVDRLQSARSQHPRDVAVCLAEAYRRMGEYAQARRALVPLLAENERDVDVLRQLAALAAAEKDWSASMAFQQQVVALDDSWTNVIQWARYYSESKRDEWLTEARGRQRMLMRSWAETYRKYRAQMQSKAADDPQTVALRQELVNLNWARNKYHDKEQVLDPNSNYHRRYGDIWLQIALDFEILELAGRGPVTTQQIERRFADSIRRAHTSAAYTLRTLCEKKFLVQQQSADGEESFNLARPAQELYEIAIRDFGERMLGAAIELSDVELARLNQIVEVAGAETAAPQKEEMPSARP
jgi:tetratricopeptide (TPR) repeat protein